MVHSQVDQRRHRDRVRLPAHLHVLLIVRITVLHREVVDLMLRDHFRHIYRIRWSPGLDRHLLSFS